jgi:two-component system alkaline phosphatase synthesis response regulator PhoP
MINSKEVLIVEDDKDINDFIAYSLRKEGFLVEQIFDGLSARQRLASTSNKIVILDIMLPGLDGFDLCKQIKDDPRHAGTFIVIISAKCHEQDKLYAHLLGADYYLVKPFSLVSLLSVLKEVKSNLSREFLVKSS